MSTPVLPLAVAAVRSWVRLYTAGLPAELRLARRGEVDSDLWEHVTAAAGEGYSPAATAGAVLSRCVRGVAADLFWRFSLKGEPKMVSKTFAERSAGIALLLLVAFLLGVLASGFGIGAEVQYFRDDFPELARDPGGFGLGIVLGTMMSIVILAAAAALYLTFRAHEPRLATFGAFGLTAAGVLMLVAMAAAYAVHDLAGEWASAGTAGDEVWTAARAMALVLEFVSFTALFLLLGSMATFGALIFWKAPLPRWVATPALAGGALLALCLLAVPITGNPDFFWFGAMFGLMAVGVWLFLAGGWLLLKGTYSYNLQAAHPAEAS